MPQLESQSSELSEKYKNIGNEYYKLKKYQKAIEFYTKGLKLDRKHLNCLSNRAMAYTKIQNNGLALQDLLQVLAQDPTHKKSLIRTAKIYYVVRRYEKSEQYLVKFKKEAGATGEFRDLLDLLLKRTEERDTGVYNFSEMYQNSKSNKFLDYANYRGPIEIKDSPGKGRGLFATADIRFGSLIMVQNALAVSLRDKSPDTTEINNLRLKVISKSKDPLFIESLQELSLFNERHDFTTSFTSEIARKLCESNAFVMALTAMDYVGLFGLPSLLNHDCFANTMYCFWGDVMVVRALRDIKKGEEITTIYSNTPGPLHSRTVDMRAYQFKCLCDLCKLDKKMGRMFPGYVACCELFKPKEDPVQYKLCYDYLKKAPGVAARFRLSCLSSTVSSVSSFLSSAKAREFFKGLRPYKNIVISADAYELSLMMYKMISPNYENDYNEWIALRYFKGYNMEHVSRILE